MHNSLLSISLPLPSLLILLLASPPSPPPFESETFGILSLSFLERKFIALMAFTLWRKVGDVQRDRYIQVRKTCCHGPLNVDTWYINSNIWRRMRLCWNVHRYSLLLIIFNAHVYVINHSFSLFSFSLTWSPASPFQPFKLFTASSFLEGHWITSTKLLVCFSSSHDLI